MPTPVEHYEEAERLLDEAAKASDPLAGARMVTRASVEAALAAVPWSRDEVDEVAAGLDREEVAALLAVADELWHYTAGQPTVPDAGPGAYDQAYAEGHVIGEGAAMAAVRKLLAPIRPLLDRQ